ncbi:VWA domain-containing protein [Streptomyces sp. NBC_00984]|uniref:vWA domain-containing protein n=1 Tax=Streptomyces sp. NBC_00984 TaxID=2903700 RepID=UPI0038630A7C|nr:VWA domain-containing protein [Streptomyces sp. NBC_00984]
MKHISPSWPLRFGPGCAAVLAAALLAASPVAAAHATPAAGSGAPSRAEIYRTLALDQEPADYVILVDTSGSMAKDGRYNTVRSTLRRFLDGLTAKDHVALFTFDSQPEGRYIGAAGDTEKIVSKLPSKPEAAGDTDIGAALNAALTELDRDDDASVASVVLLTDGRHHPPRGSRYPKSEGPSWDALRKRAQVIAGHTDLAGYALPLGNGATGARLVGNVVRNTSVLRPQSIQDLGSYLARAGEGARARKAGLLLAEDSGKGVRATWQGGATDVTDGRATAKLVLRSTTRHLPLTVSGLKASLTGPSLDVTGLPDEVTLEPGASRTFEVRLRGRLTASALPYRRTEHRDATLHLTGRVGSTWERPLAPDVELDVPGAMRVGQKAVPLRATVGSAVLLPALVTAVLLLGLGAWLWWRRINRPLLHGELLLAAAFGEQQPDRVGLDGRRVALRPSSVGGRGRVQGRLRSTEQGPRIDLRIRYTPDGSTARESRATCRPGGSVVVGGVSFIHVPEPAPAPAEGLPR